MELVFRASDICDAGDDEDGQETNVTDSVCQQLDRILEAAVITSWPELVADGESGLVHFECDYGVAGDITRARS